MKKIMLAMVVVALILGALNYHIIRMDKGFKILKKADLSFKHTFVDARGAKKIKLYLNPALARSGIKKLNPLD